MKSEDRRKSECKKSFMSSVTIKQTAHHRKVSHNLFYALRIEPEIRHIVVLHHVGLQLETLFAGAFGLCLATRRDKICKTDDLGANEALLNVRMNRAGGFPGSCAGANWPGAIFFSANGQETDVATFLERPHHQRLGRRQFGLCRDNNRLVRIEIVRRYGFEFVGRKANRG